MPQWLLPLPAIVACNVFVRELAYFCHLRAPCAFPSQSPLALASYTHDAQKPRAMALASCSWLRPLKTDCWDAPTWARFTPATLRTTRWDNRSCSSQCKATQNNKSRCMVTPLFCGSGATSTAPNAPTSPVAWPPNASKKGLIRRCEQTERALKAVPTATRRGRRNPARLC